MGYVFIYFIICLFLNMLISTIIALLIPSYYLAQIVTSVVIAFLYSLLITPERRWFYKSQRFWMVFFGLSIIFLLLDWVTFALM